MGFLGISVGEVAGGWFPAPEPLIVGGAARPRSRGAVTPVLSFVLQYTECCRIVANDWGDIAADERQRASMR